LVGSKLVQSELVRRLAEVLGEVRHDLQILASCNLGVVATLEFLQHLSTQLGHRDLFMTKDYSSHQSRTDRMGTREASAAPAASFIPPHSETIRMVVRTPIPETGPQFPSGLNPQFVQLFLQALAVQADGRSVRCYAETIVRQARSVLK